MFPPPRVHGVYVMLQSCVRVDLRGHRPSLEMLPAVDLRFVGPVTWLIGQATVLRGSMPCAGVTGVEAPARLHDATKVDLGSGRLVTQVRH